MRVVIAGSSGLIGSALRRSYELDGHTVTRLVRRETQSPHEIRWNPGSERLSSAALDGADVVVNLAGASIGQRWTANHRRAILLSRTTTARTLAEAIAGTTRPPRVFLSASGIRFYGVDRGDELLTESSAGAQDGFMPKVAHAWEAATRESTVPVCHLRLGLVLSQHGGLLARMLPIFRAGLGISPGSGHPFWSFLSLTDAVRAIRFLATHPQAQGPYNLTAPNPVRSRECVDALSAAVGARTTLPIPVPVLRLVMGEVAAEAIGSLRVVPNRLAEAGFTHRHPDIASSVRDALT